MSDPGRVERLAGVLHEIGCGCGTPSDHSRAEAQALAPVVEQMLAEAWDSGKHSDHTPVCRLGDGDCICRNPYREVTE